MTKSVSYLLHAGNNACLWWSLAAMQSLLRGPLHRINPVLRLNLYSSMVDGRTMWVWPSVDLYLIHLEDIKSTSLSCTGIYNVDSKLNLFNWQSKFTHTTMFNKLLESHMTINHYFHCQLIYWLFFWLIGQSLKSPGNGQKLRGDVFRVRGDVFRCPKSKHFQIEIIWNTEK